MHNVNSVIDKVDLLYREKARYELDRAPVYNRDIYYGNAYVEDKKTVDQELQEAIKNAYSSNYLDQFGSTKDGGYVVRRQDAEANNIFPMRDMIKRVIEEYKRILFLCNRNGFRFINSPVRAKKVEKVSVVEVGFRKRRYGFDLCFKITIDSIDLNGNYHMDIRYAIPLIDKIDQDKPVPFDIVTEEIYDQEFERTDYYYDM